ncbi:MAG: hypothetical protein GXX09_03745 [Syntrophomonadaceae bacterium]|nr:hypothetical protein [Syntrophomonadaceae bacterium]
MGYVRAEEVLDLRRENSAPRLQRRRRTVVPEVNEEKQLTTVSGLQKSPKERRFKLTCPRY